MAPVIRPISYAIDSISTKLARYIKSKSNRDSFELFVSPFYWSTQYHGDMYSPFYWQPIWDFDTRTLASVKSFLLREVSSSKKHKYFVEVTGTGYHIVCRDAILLHNTNDINNMRKRFKREYGPLYRHLDVVSSIRDVPIRRSYSRTKSYSSQVNARAKQNNLSIVIPLEIDEFDKASAGGLEYMLAYCRQKHRSLFDPNVIDVKELVTTYIFPTNLLAT